MQSIISILGAAAVVTSVGCAHVPQPEATPETQTLALSSAPGAVADPAAPPAQETGPVASAEPSQAAAAPATNTQLAAYDAAEEPPDDANANVEATGDTAKADTKEAAEPVVLYSAGDVALSRFVLTRAIEEREPVDDIASFEPGERVYAYLQAVNLLGERYNVNVRWAPQEGDPGDPIAVTIGHSPRWRTWTFRNAPSKPGTYRCIVETEAGEVVAELPFEVEG